MYDPPPPSVWSTNPALRLARQVFGGPVLRIPLPKAPEPRRLLNATFLSGFLHLVLAGGVLFASVSGDLLEGSSSGGVEIVMDVTGLSTSVGPLAERDMAPRPDEGDTLAAPPAADDPEVAEADTAIPDTPPPDTLAADTPPELAEAAPDIIDPADAPEAAPDIAPPDVAEVAEAAPESPPPSMPDAPQVPDETALAALAPDLIAAAPPAPQDAPAPEPAPAPADVPLAAAPSPPTAPTEDAPQIDPLPSIPPPPAPAPDVAAVQPISTAPTAPPQDTLPADLPVQPLEPLAEAPTPDPTPTPQVAEAPPPTPEPAPEPTPEPVEPPVTADVPVPPSPDSIQPLPAPPPTALTAFEAPEAPADEQPEAPDEPLQLAAADVPPVVPEPELLEIPRGLAGPERLQPVALSPLQDPVPPPPEVAETPPEPELPEPDETTMEELLASLNAPPPPSAPDPEELDTPIEETQEIQPPGVESDLGGALAAALGDISCGSLNPQATDGEIQVSEDGIVSISGFVSSAEDLDALRTRVAAIPQINGMDESGVVAVEPGLCSGLIHYVNSGIAASADPELPEDFDNMPAELQAIVYNPLFGQVNGAQTEVQPSQYLDVYFETPDYPAYAYVDFFRADGTVLHILPSETWPNHFFEEPNQTIEITGQDQSDGQVLAGDVLGQGMVVALVTNQPVFPFGSVRPWEEDAESYLAALDIALAEAELVDTFESEYSYVFIQIGNR